MTRKKSFFRVISGMAVILAAIFYFNGGPCFAGPDGSGNNFFYKGPMSFSYVPPGKLITEQAFDYQAFNSKFDDNGSIKHLGYHIAKYVYAPQLIYTFKAFGFDNYSELVLPFGKAVISSRPGRGSYGLDDPVAYYGIYVWRGNSKSYFFDFMPQLSVTFPYGNWNPSSLVNIGGDEWQFQPVASGVMGFKLNENTEAALNFAAGYSINKGHPSVNDFAVDNDGFSYTNPGNNFFCDIFLNFIKGDMDIYDETVYVSQENNYGYFDGASGNMAYGFINSGYQDFIDGLGVSYHYKKSLTLDLRALKDLHGYNAPDGGYGELDAVYDFK